MSPERLTLRAAGRYAVVGALVTFVTVPVYLYVEPPWRGLVVRLAVAFVLGVALLELRGALAERLASAGGVPRDEGWTHGRTWPDVPQPFLDAVTDVRAGARSRRHFEEVLWPRLEALATRPLPPPPCRSLGRGPSVASLRAVIAALEEER